MIVPLGVGIVGTGYVARTRAEVFQQDERSHLIALSGSDPGRTTQLCDSLGIESVPSWQGLVQREDLDLVVVATVNCDHSRITKAALEAGKHVIVEYPLALEVSEAEELIALAQQQQRLLHVEHIELLGGLHQGIKQALPQIGQAFYGEYSTINPKHPAPQKWTYQQSRFGFPLMGALSRLHRWIDLFGQVIRVNCQSRFWFPGPAKQPDLSGDLYRACLCQAQLEFQSGLVAQILYGKGETFWHPENRFVVQGEVGTLVFTPQEGQLITPSGSQTLEVQSRRGIFLKDTQMVLSHLLDQSPLYITAADSLYTLKVAEAARQSASLNQPVVLTGQLK
ncbi:MAG: Gfo/Idh/MocA family oxidoreductase [Oscillatoriales cyanobacterium RM2_1_1]|nr:Gfo/Idh/MocA family oxidoreductase [Oscillatoriales cyanobacterium SM2_3_0]NJO47257.1 Gfo/Idh/MocA family oxidoreductase [Oscillatoriales cyanobacterium RM2_1_1]